MVLRLSEWTLKLVLIVSGLGVGLIKSLDATYSWRALPSSSAISSMAATTFGLVVGGERPGASGNRRMNFHPGYSRGLGSFPTALQVQAVPRVQEGLARYLY